MVAIVVDASITLAWCLPEGRTKEATSICRRVRGVGAVVPNLWSLEVANTVVRMVRRGVLPAPFLAETLRDLRKLPITVEPGSRERTWGTVIELTAAHGLTVYDAAYLELARRRRLRLAALDREFTAAATAAGIPVLPTTEPTPPPPRPRRGKRV